MLFKEKKLSTNIKGFIIVLLLLFALLITYFLDNYNRFTVYKYSFNNNYFASYDGIAYFTPNQRGITLSNIRYIGNNDLFIKKASISIVYEHNNTTKEIVTSEIDNTEQAININDYLSTLTINWEENKINRLTKDIELFFKENIYIKIDVINSVDEELSYKIEVNASKMCNNKLFYLN